MKPLFALLVFLAASYAHPAAAQFFISPSLTTTVSSPSIGATSSKAGFAVAFGAVGKVFGTETELAYQSELLDNTLNEIAKNNVVTLFQNLLIGPKVGPVKVYGAIGGGNLHLNVTSARSLVVPTADSIKSNYFALTLGGGVMGVVAPHIALRGDLRYVRAYGFNFDDLEAAGLSLDEFDFWRASIGAAFTF
jgi:opacity protein-like surface antigen